MKRIAKSSDFLKEVNFSYCKVDKCPTSQNILIRGGSESKYIRVIKYIIEL